MGISSVAVASSSDPLDWETVDKRRFLAFGFSTVAVMVTVRLRVGLAAVVVVVVVVAMGAGELDASEISGNSDVVGINGALDTVIGVGGALVTVVGETTLACCSSVVFEVAIAANGFGTLNSVCWLRSADEV